MRQVIAVRPGVDPSEIVRVTSPGAGDPQPRPPVLVRVGEPGDDAVLARWHLREWPDGFFARLGPGFLTEWYAAQRRSPHVAVHVAAIADERLVGAAVTVFDAAAHHAHLARHERRRLAAAGARALLARPHLAAFFLHTRAARYLRRLREAAAAPPAAAPRQALGYLERLVVEPELRGQRLGALLLELAERAARQRGVRTLMLVTSADGAAVRFYLRAGWQRHGLLRDPEGRTLVAMRRDLTLALPAPARPAAAGVTRS